MNIVPLDQSREEIRAGSCSGVPAKEERTCNFLVVFDNDVSNKVFMSILLAFLLVIRQPYLFFFIVQPKV